VSHNTCIRRTQPRVRNSEPVNGSERLGVAFRVDAPVTRRTPHRSGREGFPHPVPRWPQALRPWRTKQATPRLAHNFAVPWQHYCTASCAILWGFGNMVCDHGVSPIVPPRSTLCPASPSLQWVPRDFGSPPSQPVSSGFRYYVPLRLPEAHLGVLRFYPVGFRYLVCSPFFVSPLMGSSGGETTSLRTPGGRFMGSPALLCLPDSYKETTGSPKFPSYPFELMHWSQIPVVT
jgi:hypothetical protein